MAEISDLPPYRALELRGGGRSQTSLTPAERRENVGGAFSPAGRAEHTVRRAHILLVDDVVTTGASLTTASDALLAAGARSVRSVVVAATPAPGWRPDGVGRSTARVAP